MMVKVQCFDNVQMISNSYVNVHAYSVKCRVT